MSAAIQCMVEWVRGQAVIAPYRVTPRDSSRRFRRRLLRAILAELKAEAQSTQ
jgi:hypothetical protein